MTLDYEIREATESDASGIAFVHVNSWQTSYAGIIEQSFLDNISYDKRLASWTEILKSKDSVHLVATFDGKIIGFASAGPVRSESHVDLLPQEPSIGEIYAIYLMEQHKGKGCGKALFNRCCLWLRQQGFASFVVGVLADNIHARHFYERQGGKIMGEVTINIGDKDYQETYYLFTI